MPNSSYSAKLVGVSGTRTESEDIQGVYNSSKNVHEFEVIKTGRYQLWLDPSGGSSYVLDSDWDKAGLSGKVLLGSDTADMYENLDSFNRWKTSAIAEKAINPGLIKLDSLVIALEDSGYVYVAKSGDVHPGQYAKDLVFGLPGTMLGDAGMGVLYDKNELSGYEYNGGSIDVDDGSGWHDNADCGKLTDQTGEYLLFTGLAATDSVVITFSFNDSLPNYGGFAYWQPFVHLRDTTGYTYPDTIKVYLSHDGVTWGTPADGNWIVSFADNSFYGLWMGQYKNPSGMIGDRWKYARFVFKNFHIGTSYNYLMVQELGIRHYNAPPLKSFATLKNLSDSVKNVAAYSWFSWTKDWLTAMHSAAPGDTFSIILDRGLTYADNYALSEDTLGISIDSTVVVTHKQLNDTLKAQAHNPGGVINSVQYNNAGEFGGFGEWDNATLNIPGDVSIPDSNKIIIGSSLGLQYSSTDNIFRIGTSLGKGTNSLFIGPQIGYLIGNNAIDISDNVFIGDSNTAQSLGMNTTSKVSYNFAIGPLAAFRLGIYTPSDVVWYNTAIGPSALKNAAENASRVEGNVSIGTQSLLAAGRYNYSIFSSNLSIGHNCGLYFGEYSRSSSNNVLIGPASGSYFGQDGYNITDNVVIGGSSGYGFADLVNLNVRSNVLIGPNAGYDAFGSLDGNYNIDNNIAIGPSAMREYSPSAPASGVLALGYYAGFQKSGSYKLYLGYYPPTYGHLITGDFASDSLSINGSSVIRDWLGFGDYGYNRYKSIWRKTSDLKFADANNDSVSLDSLQMSYHGIKVRKSPFMLNNYASKNDNFVLDLGRGLGVDIGSSVEDTVAIHADTTVLVTHDSLANKLREWKYIPVDISVGGSNTATETEVSNGWLAYSFPDAATRYIRFNTSLPPEFDDAVAAEVVLEWFTTTTSATCRWALEYQPLSLDEDADNVAGFAITQNETSSSTTEGLVESTFKLGSTDIESNDKIVQWKLSREGASIFDTVNAAVYLLNVVVKYKTTE